jgi:hypothetical protein
MSADVFSDHRHGETLTLVKGRAAVIVVDMINDAACGLRRRDKHLRPLDRP